MLTDLDCRGDCSVISNFPGTYVIGFPVLEFLLPDATAILGNSLFVPHRNPTSGPGFVVGTDAFVAACSSSTQKTTKCARTRGFK